jgi:hypothetical protein
MNSYVYVYLDTRKPGIFIYDELKFEYEPFYVGKGYGNRAYEHIDEKRIINTHKSGKIKKIKYCGLLPKILFLYENLDDVEAQKIEIEIIKKIGRYPNGPLTNMTDGGDGSLGLKRSIESINKQKESIRNNKEWYDKMKSKEFSNKMSNILKKYYSIDENKKLISENKIGEKNPMYGKKTSEKQKESVRKAHAEGKIKLSESGIESIRNSSFLRRGKKNIKIRCDIKEYILISPQLEEFLIHGNKKLQLFCKDNKLQLHVLKKYNNNIITEDMIIGNKIFAKNTIGWILKKN